MTPKMKVFLTEAARAVKDRGIIVPKLANRIAHKAAHQGFGMLITAPLVVFIINQEGRDALVNPK